jgi:hypothetical protein
MTQYRVSAAPAHTLTTASPRRAVDNDAPRLQDSPMDVPASLRRWFVAHAVVDLVIGLPLLLAPGLLLPAVGWSTVDPASARLVGAALLAIGAQSYLRRAAGLEVYTLLLDLKIVWALSAIFGLVLSIGEGAPPAAWAALSLFIAFCGVWIHYRVRFKQLAAANDLDPAPDSDPDAESLSSPDDPDPRDR